MKILINFKRLDYGNIKFHSVAEKMAKFVYEHQEYFYNLAYVIRTSKSWTLRNCQKELRKYTNPLKPAMTMFRRDEKLDQDYVDILKCSYGLCRNDADIHILRGILAEYVFSNACKVKKPNGNWKLETGCAVEIDGQKVEYRNDVVTDSKKTVDLGGWNFSEQKGIFAEVKVSPDVFCSKDSGFLQNLKNILVRYKFICYKIYVFSLEQKNLMREKIESLGYAVGSDTVILDPASLFTEDFFAF